MRLTGFKGKSRFTVALSAAIAVFILSACGSSNATATAIVAGSGFHVWGVFTTDSTAMGSIKASLNKALTGGGLPSNVTIQDGDQHSGSHICGFNVSKNSHTYQVDYYTDSSLPSTFDPCSSAQQQQLLSQAP